MKRNLLLFATALLFAFSANAQLFSDNFQDGDFAGWTTVCPDYATQPYIWKVSEYQGEFYLSTGAWDGSADHATTQWIVSPSFSTVGESGASISFDNRARYNVNQDIELYVSTDFAGDSASFDAATWTQVTGFAVDQSYGDYDWLLGATADLGNVGGQANVYIAFKYVSIDGAGGNWVLNNIEVTGTTGINTVASSVFSMYPNPVSDVLTVNGDIANVTITNAIGQEVIKTNQTSISTTNLRTGLYFVTVTDIEGNTATRKLIKK